MTGTQTRIQAILLQTVTMAMVALLLTSNVIAQSTASIPSLTGHPTGDVVVPITVNPADGVNSMEFTFQYDPAVLQATAVYRTAYTDTFVLTSDLGTSGTVSLLLTGGPALSGADEVAWVTFDVVGGSGEFSDLVWTACLLNAGGIPCIPSDGRVTAVTAQAQVFTPDDASGLPTDSVTIPISTSFANGVDAIDLKIEFNEEILQAISVAKTSLTSSMSLIPNVSVAGEVRISLFSITPLAGSGDLVNITFSVVGDAANTTPLNLTRATFNEGAISTVMDDGLFSVDCAGDDDGDGWSICAGDCDDNDAASYPGALESCDGNDNDCSGTVPIDETDDDGDLYVECSGWTDTQGDDPIILGGGDCDDSVATCTIDCTDDDIDGTADCADTCLDADGDGYGSAGGGGNSCTGADCDDAVEGCTTDCTTDSDEDTIADCYDNCLLIENPGQENADFDDAGDLCDACVNDPFDDRDADGHCGDVDNCPDTPNTDQFNEDFDLVGNACDNCPSTDNPGQFDADDDGEGDACEDDVDGDGDPDDTDPDDDEDGVLDVVDNCPTVPNPNQLDWDDDGEGDACDLDDGEVGGGHASLDPLPGRGGSQDSVVFRYDWIPESGWLAYHVYRVLLSDLSATNYGACYRSGILTTYTEIGEYVPFGQVYGYLVTAEFPGGEGTLGQDSDGNNRPNTSPCP